MAETKSPTTDTSEAKPTHLKVGQRWGLNGLVLDVESFDGTFWWLGMGGYVTSRTEAHVLANGTYLGMIESAKPGGDSVVKQTPQERINDILANLEAFNLLIANPPDWAIPKAWIRAVYALLKRATLDEHRIFLESGDRICVEMLHEECERAHKRQPRISGVVYDPIRDVLFDAYASGMAESAKPDVESVYSTMPNKSPSEFTFVPTITTTRIVGDSGIAYRDRDGVIASDEVGVERFITENYKRQFVTLSDTQRRTLRHMLLEQRAQSEEEPSESLQGIASKAKLGGTLDLSANECATVLDTMPAFEVDHWIEVADLLKALKRGREI